MLYIECRESGVGVVEYVCFFQAEDGIRDLVRSRGLGDVYKRQEDDAVVGGLADQRIQPLGDEGEIFVERHRARTRRLAVVFVDIDQVDVGSCLLYTSDAADERSSVDLGGRRIIKKKNKKIKT